MFSGNGVERGVSEYSYVQVLRKRYTSWEQVHCKLFLHRIFLPNEIYTMLYSITRRDSVPKDNRDRIGRLKTHQIKVTEVETPVWPKWQIAKFSAWHSYLHKTVTKKRNIKYHKKKMISNWTEKIKQCKCLPWKRNVVICSGNSLTEHLFWMKSHISSSFT